MKRLRTLSVQWLALAGAALCVLPYGLRAEHSVFPTGVTRYEPDRAYNSFVVFAGSDGKTHLIDMTGNEVHRWELAGFPSGIIDPARTGGARGHVMVQISAIPGEETGIVPGTPEIFRNKIFGELDWDGKIVWQWGNEAPGGAARQHHDWQRLANGNTLVLSNLNHKIFGFKLATLLDDVIYEVAPDGKVAWRWLAGDHLEEFGFRPQQLALVRKSEGPDYLHVNDMK
jgi:Arylsulfotransferase (ASST)